MTNKRTKLNYAVFFLLGGWLTFLASMSSWPCRETAINAREATFQQLQKRRVSPLALGKPDPAGLLEATEIPFSHPDGIFPDRDDRLKKVSWFFEGFSEIELARFLGTCDLKPLERTMVLDRHAWTSGSNGCVIVPSEDVIWSLSPRAREQIYSVLARSPANYPQYYPFRFGLGGFERKFEGSGIPAKSLEMLEGLTYTNNGYLCFADLQALHTALKPCEFNELVDTLCSVPAFLLRLHVTPDSDVTALIRYWGKGGREGRIAPLIKSLARVPGGGRINVSYLLPPYARVRLYTYPDGWENRTPPLEDCTFTALNFFNDTPNTNLFDMACREKALNSDYRMITDEPQFGDLVTLMNSKEQLFHASVYIAAGFVFTKNGINPNQPWILMKISDMLGIYDSVEKGGRLVFLRRKTDAGAESRIARVSP